MSVHSSVSKADERADGLLLLMAMVIIVVMGGDGGRKMRGRALPVTPCW